MAQKINSTPPLSQPVKVLEKKEFNSNRVANSSPNLLAPSSAEEVNKQMAQLTLLAKKQPLSSHLSQLIALLKKLPLTSQPKALHTLLGQLFPTSPSALTSLLQQLLSPEKNKANQLALRWLALTMKFKDLQASSLEHAIKDVLQGIQVSQHDTPNHQVWLMQLPWFMQQQLKTVQLKIKQPKKSEKGKKKWQIQLKLPISDHEMLAHAVIEESIVDIKLYTTHEADLARIQAYQGLLSEQLSKAGVRNHCQSFLGKVTEDFCKEIHNEAAINIIV